MSNTEHDSSTSSNSFFHTGPDNLSFVVLDDFFVNETYFSLFLKFIIKH